MSPRESPGQFVPEGRPVPRDAGPSRPPGNRATEVGAGRGRCCLSHRASLAAGSGPGPPHGTRAQSLQLFLLFLAAFIMPARLARIGGYVSRSLGDLFQDAYLQNAILGIATGSEPEAGPFLHPGVPSAKGHRDVRTR